MTESKPLLVIIFDFYFENMKEADTRFLNLQFFEKIKARSKSYVSKDRVEDDMCYSIRVFTSLNKYNDLLNFILDEVLILKEKLIDLGLNECYYNCSFCFEYYQKTTWTLTHEQLVKLNTITDKHPGIALDSINHDWKKEYETFPQEVYYQLIFTSEDSEFSKIRRLWEEEFKEKYQHVLNWHIQKQNNVEKRILILSIPDDTGEYKWDEVFTDQFSFLKKHKNFFAKNNIIPSYVFFQHNRSSLNGGEVGTEVVLGLVELGLGLQITMDTNPPTSNYLDN